MIELLKQVFFFLFWFTADVAIIFFWILVVSALAEKLTKHD